MIAERVAGQGSTMQQAEVEGAPDPADVIEGEARYEVKVAEVDEAYVMAEPTQVGKEGMHAEGMDDLVDLASFDRGIDDADAAGGARGLESIVEDGPQEGAVGGGSLELASGDLVVQVAGGYEVRLDDDPVAWFDQVAEGVPIWGTDARAVESEVAKQGFDGFVDGVGRVEGRGFVVGEVGTAEGCDALSGVMGHGGSVGWMGQAWGRRGSNARRRRVGDADVVVIRYAVLTNNVLSKSHW